jgi:hypothetical protein
MPEAPEKRERLSKAEKRKRKNAKAEAARRAIRAQWAPARPRWLLGHPARLVPCEDAGGIARVPPAPVARLVSGLIGGIWTSGESRYAIPPDAKLFGCLTFRCWDRTDLLNGREATRYAEALLALSAHWRDWLRPPDEWVPPDAAPDDQFGSLTRHLLARYDVPAFLDAAWFAGLTPEGVRHQGWFKLIGRGENLRTAGDLPIPLTKRMAHCLLQTPPGLGIPEAFRYAQVRALGGDERLARSLPETRIGTDFECDEFWVPVIRWLIAHPTLDRAHHGPIIDYLHDQKFVPSVPNAATRVRGQPRQPLLVPPQPNLSMAGRTPRSLLRQVEAWHKELGSRRLGASARWKPTGLAPLAHEEGEGTGRKVYETTELITSEELDEEGRAMGHCVATYWHLCEVGHSSIWSLTVEDASGRVERLLTLQINTSNRLIVQASGKSNLPPTAQQFAILERWADAGGPALSEHLRAPPIGLDARGTPWPNPADERPRDRSTGRAVAARPVDFPSRVAFRQRGASPLHISKPIYRNCLRTERGAPRREMGRGPTRPDSYPISSKGFWLHKSCHSPIYIPREGPVAEAGARAR